MKFSIDDLRNYLLIAYLLLITHYLLIDDFFSKCDKIRLLKKSLMENFIFCAVSILHEYKHLHMKKYFVPSRKLKHTVLA